MSTAVVASVTWRMAWSIQLRDTPPSPVPSDALSSTATSRTAPPWPRPWRRGARAASGQRGHRQEVRHSRGRWKARWDGRRTWSGGEGAGEGGGGAMGRGGRGGVGGRGGPINGQAPPASTARPPRVSPQKKTTRSAGGERGAEAGGGAGGEAATGVAMEGHRGGLASPCRGVAATLQRRSGGAAWRTLSFSREVWLLDHWALRKGGCSPRLVKSLPLSPWRVGVLRGCHICT